MNLLAEPGLPIWGEPGLVTGWHWPYLDECLGQLFRPQNDRIIGPLVTGSSQKFPVEE
jgi:hypothetical protein